MTETADPSLEVRHLRVTLGSTGRTFAVFPSRGVWAAWVADGEVLTASYQANVPLTEHTPTKRLLLRSLSRPAAEQWREFLRATFPEGVTS